jgi:formiminotetrahydrofolate cyclodeaminase
MASVTGSATHGDAGGVAARVSTSNPLDAWLDKLAQASGAPGGGAACGVMLGMSAALLRMVARYTEGDERAMQCAARLADRRRDALRAAEVDGVRSAALGAALATRERSPQEEQRVRDAALAAAASSADLGSIGSAILEELHLMAEIGNPAVAADLAVAAEALAAALAGVSVNLRADLQLASAHHTGDDRASAQPAELSDAARRVAASHATARATASALSEEFAVD